MATRHSTHRSAAALVRLNVIQLFSAPRKPIVQRRRRGRYPQGVTNIKTVPRLKVGALVELVGIKAHPQNNGTRGTIIKYNADDRWCWQVKFARGVRCADGSTDTRVWFMEKNLRRVWISQNVDEIRQLKTEQGWRESRGA